jgi:hypothetical protein
MNRRNGGERRGVNRVRHSVDAVEKIADQRRGLVEAHLFRAKVKLAQIGAGAEAGLHRTVNDQRMRFVFQRLVSLDEFLKLFESLRADLVARLPMQSKLDAAVTQFPRQSCALKAFHALL